MPKQTKKKKAQPAIAEAPLQSQTISDLVELLNAHIQFARLNLQFTSESLAEIRRSLAGIE